MKLLENRKLEEVIQRLSVESGECRIDGRLESYSCKMAGDDKRLFRTLVSETGLSPADLQALSPPKSCLAHSPSRLYSRSFSTSSYEMRSGGSGGEGEGVLCDTISLKTLFYLISTLNSSFYPDYDFSNAKSGEFSREATIQAVSDSVDCQLFTSGGEKTSTLKSELWSVIDEEICLKECEIYSYNPDLNSDPYSAEGCTWLSLIDIPIVRRDVSGHLISSSTTKTRKESSSLHAELSGGLLDDDDDMSGLDDEVDDGIDLDYSGLELSIIVPSLDGSDWVNEGSMET